MEISPAGDKDAARLICFLSENEAGIIFTVVPSIEFVSGVDMCYLVQCVCYVEHP